MEQCVVQRLKSFPLTDVNAQPLDELFPKPQALVGLIVKNVKVDYNHDGKTFGAMNLKIKIYACDVKPDFTSANQEDSTWRFVSKISTII